MEDHLILPNSKTCSKCGISKSLDDFYRDKRAKDNKQSQCKECMSKKNKKYRQKHRSEKSEYDKKYYLKHKDEVRQRTGQVSMYENKLCSSYLGVVVAERLCRHLFKDVEVMPYGNTGFDIICNKGMKIDVKSKCTDYTNKSKIPRWKFTINYNIVADYFIFVAFDNRIDLNPLHMWMIPGKEINHRASKSIALSRIHKWDKWKRDINDAQLCCAELKNKSCVA